jgi:hypothetical protein
MVYGRKPILILLWEKRYLIFQVFYIWSLVSIESSAAKPWLVNPVKAWGGGIVGPDGGMKADFDQVEMIVKEFKFRPFPEYLALQRNVGETYPLGGYSRI